MYFIIQYDDPVIAGFLIPRSFHCAYSLWWALEFLCWLSLSKKCKFFTEIAKQTKSMAKPIA